MIRRFLCYVSLCLVLASCGQNTASPDAVYYLVRHAEKQLDVKNPPLTQTGQARAQALASRLSGIELTDIYSTDYTRTQQTAAPVAAAKNLLVKSYDPSDLEGFAKSLLSQDGYILVAGHSNTTPQLAEFLGADPGKPIVEANEYNRLYVIERSGQTVTGRIETFGAPNDE